ncbi:MAG TPA: response regulator [Kofleriaceae bacterium]|nr:response regulator [Kofleriaceae bacterium]
MSQDPYKYFRVEAREIVADMSKEALALEKDTPSPARVAHLLRMAHTLKGAARVVKQREIADHAHTLEDALTPYRESGGPVPRSEIDVMLGLLDKIGGRVVGLDQPAAPAPSSGNGASAAPEPAAAPVEETFRSLRAEVSELDDLLDGIAEAQALLAQLGRGLSGFDRVRRLGVAMTEQRGREQAAASVQELQITCRRLERALTAGHEQIDRQLREVRQGAERMRLVAAAVILTPLERAARDVARAQGKQVRFEAVGGELRLDGHVLGAVQAALLQAVRNAVAHGIETEAERRAAGKPIEGLVRLEVARRGGRIAFVCRDDGRGVDFEAVRRVAQGKGIAPAQGQQLSQDELLVALMAGGISTSGTVSEMSGRGIGMNVVRTAVERLGGEVAVRTEAGKGTSVEIEVPLSLASLEVLHVEAGGMSVAIPLDAVRATMRLAPDQIARSSTGDTIIHLDRAVPFVSLLRTLGRTAPANGRGQAVGAVLIEAGGAAAAIGVDRLLGTGAVVIRPLPELCPAAPVVAGATLDAEGNPGLVLDPAGLVAAATRAAPQLLAAEAPRPPILVIDDSLTTRMLEQSILESAGFDVEVAVSAEDGLERARRERFALFLVDVEMPGMDGFSFIECTQADPALRNVPAILVTSRSAPEDKKRGEEVGARGYVVKGEFNQGELLERIRALVG